MKTSTPPVTADLSMLYGQQVGAAIADMARRLRTMSPVRSAPRATNDSDTRTALGLALITAFSAIEEIEIQEAIVLLVQTMADLH